MRDAISPLTILRAQAGDREALGAALAAIEPALVRYAERIAGRDASRDVVQQAFVTICAKLRWLDDASLFRPWAYRIVSREAFAHLKRAKRISPEAIPDIAAPVPEAPALTREEILARIDALPPASRAVIALHFLEEMPLADVAAVLEVPLGTVKSRLAYGLTLLRKEIVS